MKLITYRCAPDAAARLGAVVDDRVVDLAALGAAHGVALPATMLAFIDLGPDAVTTAAALLAETRQRGAPWPLGVATPLANVKTLAPIPRPRKNIFGIGLITTSTSRRRRKRWTPAPRPRKNR